MHNHSGEDFLSEFRKKYSRPPRILHIGNIANNAYLNAKFLNEAGFDCDVLCYDYYHIMGCPEWEDANFESGGLDHFKPDWASVRLNKFKRPRWFAQGPMSLCIDYLIAKRTGNKQSADAFWQQLSTLNGTSEKSTSSVFNFSSPQVAFRRFARLKQMAKQLYSRSDALPVAWAKLRAVAANRGAVGYLLVGCFLAPILISGIFMMKAVKKIARIINDKPDEVAELISKRVRQFAEAFPNRTDHLSPEDCTAYTLQAKELKRLFKHYDLVHAYATDGIWPFLADFPYVAFEHGTIRNIPFESTTQGRLCAATYRFANSVIITNADNYVAAEKLQLPAYRFVPHPVNDASDGADAPSYETLHQELDADFIIFHPARQHWDSTRHPDWEKGNDFLIKAFAKFVVNTNRRVAAIFVEWGQSVEASKRLLESLGVADRVKWVPPMSHQKMVTLVRATDVVADQFFLGAFGSTMPKALACGRPAMLYLNTGLHEWCFPQCPPVVNVRTESEILEGLEKLYSDKAYYQKLCEEGFDWYSRWHSRDAIVNKLTTIYAGVIS